MQIDEIHRGKIQLQLSQNMLLTLVAVMYIIFVIYSPSIDIFFATMPYSSITHKFYGETHKWCTVIYYLVPVITASIIIGCSVIILFANKIGKSNITNNNLRRSALIVLLSLGLGPGIVVNSVFKDNWGRARPYQVIHDGKLFSPVWQPNWGMHTSNSFPSGHASIGFFLGVPFLARRRRSLGILVGCVGGGIVGAVRILQGGHYFSDVVLCGVIVWLSAELMYYLINKILR
jgi:lipid A 4'-phosphatase